MFSRLDRLNLKQPRRYPLSVLLEWYTFTRLGWFPFSKRMEWGLERSRICMHKLLSLACLLRPTWLQITCLQRLFDVRTYFHNIRAAVTRWCVIRVRIRVKCRETRENESTKGANYGVVGKRETWDGVNCWMLNLQWREAVRVTKTKKQNSAEQVLT